MLWLYLALTAYLINAIVFIIDKHLLAGHIPKYQAYAFGVSLLSLSALVLIPFGVTWHGLSYFLIAFSSGAAFFVGLMFLYKSILESDVSVAATQTGTFGAVFTYIFSVLVLKQSLPFLNSFAFIFLIIGIFFVGKIERRILVSAFLSGLLFGISFVLLKFIFNSSDFINGIFWTRIGFFGSAGLSLISSHVRREVTSSYHDAPNRSKFIFVFNKFLSGLGFIVLYFSIRLGNVSLVNALLGFQFMFTFILALILQKWISGIRENFSREILIGKLTGITFILIGLIILFIEK